MWRVIGMFSLIVGKALAGHEKLAPMEAVFSVLEIVAVFGAGWHLALHRAHEKAAGRKRVVAGATGADPHKTV